MDRYIREKRHQTSKVWAFWACQSAAQTKSICVEKNVYNRPVASGGPGGPVPPHCLSDQLTLSQPGGAHYVSITCPSRFSDLATALRCIHFFQHKWILSGQPTDMPKKPTLSRFGDRFPLFAYPLSMVL